MNPAARPVYTNYIALGEMIDYLDGIRTGNILPIRSAQRVEGFALIANAESEERQMIAATALHVFALFIQLRRFEKDVSEDMMAARSVQERTLLRDHPSCPGLDYDVIFRPAKMVSGDYYGVIRHQGSTTGFAVADVSGKGVPAALIMATINTSLHDTMSKSGDGIGALMTRLHNIVFKASPPARYATLVYALYDADRNSLQYVNAGHQPAPILVRGSKIVELEHGGPVLGLMENPIVPFGVGRVSLQPDDVIVIATDGVSDSVNAQGEMWGIESLHLACIEACGHRLKSARSIADKIMKEALRFCNDYPVQDDMTLMVLRVLK